MATKTRRVACCIASFAALLTFIGAPRSLFAQETKSRAAAKELAETLDRLKLDAIAAPDPAASDSFVAALYFQGATLLVVSARYAAPSLLTAKLEKKDYRDIYIDLNAASVAGSKVFVMDTGANGLLARPDDSAPDSYENGNKSIAFDGDWRKAKMSSENEYLKSFADADDRYARMLTVLTEQAKKGGS